MITKADLSEWKNHPTTKEVFERIKAQMEACKTSSIELGRVEGKGHDIAANSARYDALKDVLTMESDEGTEEDE